MLVYNKQLCETRTGQQLAQLHDRYSYMMMMIIIINNLLLNTHGMNIKVRNISPISQASYLDRVSRITTVQFNSCNVTDRQTNK
jgi:hypothetical protein